MAHSERPRIGLVLGAGGVLGGAWLTGALHAIASETGWDPGSSELHRRDLRGRDDRRAARLRGASVVHGCPRCRRGDRRTVRRPRRAGRDWRSRRPAQTTACTGALRCSARALGGWRLPRWRARTSILRPPFWPAGYPTARSRPSRSRRRCAGFAASNGLRTPTTGPCPWTTRPVSASPSAARMPHTRTCPTRWPPHARSPASSGLSRSPGAVTSTGVSAQRPTSTYWRTSTWTS